MNIEECFKLMEAATITCEECGGAGEYHDKSSTEWDNLHKCSVCEGSGGVIDPFKAKLLELTFLTLEEAQKQTALIQILVDQATKTDP